ncbi:MAG: hypothetical protein ACRC9T_01885, partial [Vibrionaceae bacterium]
IIVFQKENKIKGKKDKKKARKNELFACESQTKKVRLRPENAKQILVRLFFYSFFRVFFFSLPVSGDPL